VIADKKWHWWQTTVYTIVALTAFAANSILCRLALGRSTIAAAGFLSLVAPRLTAPSLSGAVLMTLAGIAWGVYTLRGQNSKNPLEAIFMHPL